MERPRKRKDREMSDDRDVNAEAAKRGCIAVLPKPNELFIDIDDEAGLLAFIVSLEILNRDNDPPWTYTKAPSPSGKPFHFHITVTLDRDVRDEYERFGLQAILGSDRKREALNWRRQDTDTADPSCFFELAPKSEPVVAENAKPNWRNDMPHDYEPHAGQHIGEACKHLCELAVKLGRPATMSFNGVELSATPDSVTADVVGMFDQEMNRRHEESEAERRAWEATPEGQESVRKAEERRKYVAREVARGLLPFSVSDQEAWNKCVSVNKGDGYGECTLRYAARWANIMEAALSNGGTVATVAKAASHEADIEGITGFMYGCAVSILANTWKHGDELRRWHNLDTQIRDEGEKANESGGTLNPALMTVRAAS